MKRPSRKRARTWSLEQLETRNLLSTLIAYDTFDAQLNRTSFTKDVSDWTSGASRFQVVQRGGTGALNPSDALLDQTSAGSPGDPVGILQTTKTDKVFGISDTQATRTANWQFNVAGYINRSVSIKIAGMGDFENTAFATQQDLMNWTYSFDGVTYTPLFTSSVNESINKSYTMQSGAVRTLDDPMLLNSTQLSNAFQTFSGNVSGTGNTLYLRLQAAVRRENGLFSTDYNEGIVIDDIEVYGELPPPVVAVAGSAPYSVAEGGSVSLWANPVTFNLTGSGVNNGSLQQNEIELSAPVSYSGISLGTLNINSSISGSIVADIGYTSGVLTHFKMNNGALVVSDDSDTLNVIIAGVTLSLTGVSGYLRGTAPETIISTDGNHGGTISTANTVLTLNSGVVSLVGTGLAADVNFVIDLSTSPLELPLGDLGVNSVLTVNPTTKVGTFKFQIPNTTSILGFLGALLDPEDLAEISQYITGGTFGIDITAQADLTNEITPPSPAWTYSWDVNGDSVFGDATGRNPTLTWSALAALGINDGPGTRNVKVRVTDGTNTADSAAVTLNINNTAPTAAISGPANVVRGETVTYTLTATDPSSVDQAASFTWDIDWDNNGTWDQTVSGASGTTVQRTYGTALGSGTIKVRATDKDAGVGASSTTGFNIVEWTVRSGTLLVGLSDNPDFFILAPGWALGYTDPGDVILANLGEELPPVLASGVTNAVVYGNGGDDFISAHLIVFNIPGGLTLPVTLYGGAGNDILIGGEAGDTLYGGAGNDILVGGGGLSDGTNTLYGGDDRDILIGSFGQDFFHGGLGDDILVAGAMNVYENGDGLQAIRDEWTSGGTYASRVAHISGTAGGLNDPYYLQPDVNIFNDGQVDTLFGEGDTDWFIYEFSQDIASDVAGGEITTDFA